MTRYTPNTKIRFDVVVTDSEGTLVDPDTITFHWKTKRGGSTASETVTNDGVGLYHAFATPTEGGALYTEWRCTNPDLVVRRDLYITPSAFSEFAVNDYGN
jgi:hypothetical protein